MWDALTNAERLPRWFVPVSGTLRLGGKYQLEGNASGTITRCDPPAALDITWEFGGGLSWVTVRVEPQGDGTLLTLEHITPAAVEDAFWDKYGPGALGVGWDISLHSLRLHTDSGGDIVDLECEGGWFSSEEGKAFARACAAAWADAHIGAGENAEIARGMAERTAEFLGDDVGSR